jgi:hypothetical protein
MSSPSPATSLPIGHFSGERRQAWRTAHVPSLRLAPAPMLAVRHRGSPPASNLNNCSLVPSGTHRDRHRRGPPRIQLSRPDTFQQRCCSGPPGDRMVRWVARRVQRKRGRSIARHPSKNAATYYVVGGTDQYSTKQGGDQYRYLRPTYSDRQTLWQIFFTRTLPAGQKAGKWAYGCRTGERRLYFHPILVSVASNRRGNSGPTTWITALWQAFRSAMMQK